MNKQLELKSQFLPHINRYLVFNALKRHSPLSTDDIVRLTDISKPTVAKIIKELQQDNYVRSAGKGESVGGRKPDLYQFDAGARFILGVNFEIPKVRIIAVDLADNIITSESFSINIKQKQDTILEKLRFEIGTILEESTKISHKKLIGIGVSISGFIDQNTGVSLMTPRIPHWKNVPIVDFLTGSFNVPVRIINDTDAMTLAELEFGKQKIEDNLLYIAFTEGLGAGLVVNGELISGRFGNAGSISHMIVESGGPECICGNRGCLEVFASERGVLKNIRKDQAFRNKEITIEKVFELYKKGDQVCTKVMEEAAHYMSIGIANLITIFEVNQVVIGGSVVEAGENFLSILRENVESSLLDILKMDLSIEYAHLPDKNAGARGATIPLLKEFFKIPQLRISSQQIEVMNPSIAVGRM